MQHAFRGVFPYLVSPVDSDGSILAAELKDVVNHLLASGVHGLSPLGSTGEAVYLNKKQRLRISEIVIEEANGQVPVVPGVTGFSTREIVEEAKQLERIGADGIVPILLSYFSLEEDEIVALYHELGNNVQIPIVLYNNPRFQHFELSLEIIRKLTSVPNIQYIKDASGRTGFILTIISEFGDKLKVFSASAHLPAVVMRLGGVGWMAGPACLIPRTSVRLYNFAQAGKWEEAFALQEEIWQLNVAFQKYKLAACVKAGLEMQGFPVGSPLLPQTPISAHGRKVLAALLERLQPFEREN